jgi:hypothetical protein
MASDRTTDHQTDAATGLPLDFDQLMDDDEINRRVAAGELTGQQAAELLQAAARRRVAEQGPAEDTDADGLITQGGFGSGQGMGTQRTGQGPSGEV